MEGTSDLRVETGKRSTVPLVVEGAMRELVGRDTGRFVYALFEFAVSILWDARTRRVTFLRVRPVSQP